MDYDKIVDQLSLVENHRLVVMKNQDKKNFMIAFQHTGDIYRKDILQMIRTKYACQECGHRVKKLCVLSNGIEPLLFQKGSEDDFHLSLHQKSLELVKKTPICGIHVFRNKGIFENNQGQLGGFHHYFLQTTEESWVSEEQALLYEKASNRYVPSILPNLLSKLFPDNGKKCVEQSMEVLIKVKEIVGSSTYGYHLLPSIDWMIRICQFCGNKKMFNMSEIIKNPVHKWLFCCGFLFWTPIHPDGDRGAVSTVIQQAYNHVLELILSANNEHALKKMVESRMAPHQYMRPSTTKPLSNKVIQQSASKLGDFYNTIMSLEEASALPYSISLQKKIPSSKNSYLEMMDKKKLSIHSFLTKCEDSNIRTLTDLLEYLQNHPDADLRLVTASMTPAYVAKSTLDQKYLSVPHLWAFLNHKRPSDFKIPEIVPVELILPMYQYIRSYKNILFVIRLENDLKTFQEKIGNCCFPAFLHPTYQRELRNVFERLNTTMPIHIREQSKAFGLATSVKNMEKKLMNPITFYLNGKKITVDEL